MERRALLLLFFQQPKSLNSAFFLHFSHDVIPIVMGARPEDYADAAPHKSYIHVDDFDSPKELADYLHQLDQDDQLYNEYFKWKVGSNKGLSRLLSHPINFMNT